MTAIQKAGDVGGDRAVKSVTTTSGDTAVAPLVALEDGAVVTVSSAQVGATRRSGSITTGGVAQVLMVANSARKGWYIQNTSSDRLYVEDRTATGTVSASAAGTSIELDPGDVFNPPFTTPYAISVYGPTTGQTFAAGEW